MVEFAAEPLLQVSREGASVTSSERLQPLAPVPPNRLVVRDALCKEQPLDAVDVLDPFGGQRPALTADLPAVLRLGRRRPCHSADPRLAALVPGELGGVMNNLTHLM